jgi:glycosyltransferase involved in cell wall biosynthesis
MRVLHIASGKLSRGAHLGAYWLHQALRDIGTDSWVLTGSHKEREDHSVISLAESQFPTLKLNLTARLAKIPLYAYPHRKRVVFNTGFNGIDITKHIAYQEADIIHLHWINGLISLRTLRKIRKPVVWTLRDMWPMTGGCHYSLACEGYKNTCGRCPQLESKTEYDLSRIILNQKRKWIPKKVWVVGISQWVSECAQQSTIFKDYHIKTISNNINTKLFFPIDIVRARTILHLPLDKNIVLVGAEKIDNYYKGFDLFIKSLDYLNSDNVHIVTFGNSSDDALQYSKFTSTSLGYITDVALLRLAYSAADVFVAPSVMEAFGKTLVESMACGTPVVCFNATGPKDIVEHLVTGYKANAFDPVSLACGIKWILDQSKEKYISLQSNSRKRAIDKFDSNIIAKSYKTLYEQITS